MSGLIALATAVLQPDALVLLVSPSQRQSGELFRVVLRNLHALPGSPTITAESALRLELANASRIVALPGDERTIRGFAGAALVVLDEASRIEDELIAAVRPMLATSQGRLIALSTPLASAASSSRRGTATRHGTASRLLRVTVREFRRSFWRKSCAN